MTSTGVLPRSMRTSLGSRTSSMATSSTSVRTASPEFGVSGLLPLFEAAKLPQDFFLAIDWILMYGALYGITGLQRHLSVGAKGV